MAWSRDWDESTPVGSTTNASDIDLWLRYLQIDTAERMESMFYGFNDSSSTAPEDAYGVKHLKLYPQTSPTSVANFGFLFGKDASSKIELHYLDEGGDEVQLTSGGYLCLGSGLIANNTYIKGRNVASSANINMIRVTDSDNLQLGKPTILPDTSQTASNAAPISDTHLPNKKYVDDQLAAIVGSSYHLIDIDGTPTKVYTKYLTGTNDSTSPDTKAHGVSTALTKILSVTGVFENPDVGSLYKAYPNPQGSAGAGGAEFYLTFDATNINIYYGSDLNGGKFRLKIDYIL